MTIVNGNGDTGRWNLLLRNAKVIQTNKKKICFSYEGETQYAAQKENVFRVKRTVIRGIVDTSQKLRGETCITLLIIKVSDVQKYRIVLA